MVLAVSLLRNFCQGTAFSSGFLTVLVFDHRWAKIHAEIPLPIAFFIKTKQ